jgi:hypothetical protein
MDIELHNSSLYNRCRTGAAGRIPLEVSAPASV